MIEWRSLADLDAHLRSAPPIGLRLRAFLHATTDLDPGTVIDRAAEEYVEEGLDPARAWGGVLDGIPFLIRTTPRVHASGFGLDVSFPVCASGDRRLIEGLSLLPLPPLTSVYLDGIGAGPFGVRPVGAPEVIYRSRSHDDATAAARFATTRVGRAHEAFEGGSAAARWLVVGPSCGPFVSLVEIAHDEADARRRGAMLATATSGRFDIVRSD